MKNVEALKEPGQEKAISGIHPSHQMKAKKFI